MNTPHLEELYFLERDGCKYEGIAFDGCNFYLTTQDAICVFDLSMRKLHQVKTCQSFSSICYDPCFDCFWALSATRRQYVYRLNRTLNEIDRIVLPYQCGKPTGISCGENSNELLIATSENLYCISKSGSIDAQKIKHLPNKALFICACAADKDYLCSGIFSDGNTVRQFAPCGMSCGIILPEEYFIVDMACGRCHHEAFLLVVKDCCYYRIIRCFEEPCKCCNPCEEPCCEPCKESCCDDCHEPCCDACEDQCCDPCQKPPICQESCCDACHEPCCDACEDPCFDPCCKPDKEQELCDIIESIALIETALSHILNAEGEKLQKMLEITNEPDVLLETNKSISTTISKVTHLEYILFEKLRMVQEMSECTDEKPNGCKSHFC